MNAEKNYQYAAIALIAVALLALIGFYVIPRLIGGTGSWVCESGTWAPKGDPDTSMPTTVCPGGDTNGAEPTDGNPIPAEANIRVFVPLPNDEIGNPIVIRGQARVFENTFTYRIKDGNGKILLEDSSMTDAPDAGIFGNFTISASYPIPSTNTGAVEVFEYSAKDGAETNMVRVPVKFMKVETMKVKAFFGNSNDNPNAADCNKVSSVERTIAKTDAPGRAALTELLSGLTAEEKVQGFYTSLNTGVKIQKLTIENGVAKVDFTERLEEAVGGSCRVAAIRAQITETLKQFTTVKSVVISINGRIEDILQP